MTLDIPNSEIIVVDASSRDGTAEFLSGIKEIRFHPMLHKNTWAFNNEIGIRLARGDWICIMNPDLYFDANFNHLLAFLDSLHHSPYPMVAPQLIYPPGRKNREQWPIRNGLNLNGIFFTFISTGHILDKKIARGYFARIRDPQRTYENMNGHEVWRVEHPIGSMFLVHRTTIEKLGGRLWQRGFTFAAADSDMFRMARKKGIDIFVVPKARVVHEAGHSAKSTPKPEMEYEFAYGFTLFTRYWSEHPRLLSILYLLDAVFSPISAVMGSRMRMTVEEFAGHIMNASSRLLGMIRAWKVRIDD
jgi:GT2 family glycosyltransferase